MWWYKSAVLEHRRFSSSRPVTIMSSRPAQQPEKTLSQHFKMTRDGSSMVQYLPSSMPMTLGSILIQREDRRREEEVKLGVSVLRVEPGLYTLGYCVTVCLSKRKWA